MIQRRKQKKLHGIAVLTQNRPLFATADCFAAQLRL